MKCRIVQADMTTKICPKCGRSHNTIADDDFPDTMQNCEDCGSEWNEIEVTLNAKEV